VNRDETGPAGPSGYEAAFEGSTNAIVLTDADGRIVAANPAWLALYGYTLAEVRGQTTRVIRGPLTDASVYEQMWAQIRDPRVGSWTGELVNRTRSGAEVPVLLTITPLRARGAAGGAVTGYMGVAIDVSERKKFEELQRLYDLTVRHDLKSPLASIQALLQTLLEGYVGPLDDRQRDVVERVLAASKQMRALIDTSLDLEKLRRRTIRLDLEDVDLVAIVRASLERHAPLADRKAVGFAVEGAAGPLAADAHAVRRLDPLHVQRAVDNLVKNAVEAAPAGSVVTLTLAHEADATLLSIHNGGDPIPPHVRAVLFHPFSTYGKRGGTGLGVYGVKLTVEALGGEVAYTTGADGTTFTLRLPDAPAAPTGRPVGAAAPLG